MKKGTRITLNILGVSVALAVLVALFFLIAKIMRTPEYRSYTAKAKTQAQKPRPQKPIDQDFRLAVKGEVWIILVDNIGVTDVPQTFGDFDQYKAHVTAILMSGTKVEILKTKTLGFWKYVRTLDGTLRSGWVTGDSVKKAKKVR